MPDGLCSVGLAAIRVIAGEGLFRIAHAYLPADGDRHPERAVGVFRRLALKYPRDSAVFALMKCYEGQAWDVLRVSDSMLSCYDDASLYVEAHPEMIDMRVMSYLYSGWAHYYNKNRLTAT